MKGHLAKCHEIGEKIRVEAWKVMRLCIYKKFPLTLGERERIVPPSTRTESIRSVSVEGGGERVEEEERERLEKRKKRKGRSDELG